MMADFEILAGISTVIAKASPLLAKVLVSPAASIALNLISVALGIPNPIELLSVLKADPTALDKVKDIELKHEEVLTQIASNDFAAGLKDVEDAREAARHSLMMDWMPSIITVLLIISCIVVSALLIFDPSEKADHTVLQMILVQLFGFLAFALKYYFGQTK